VIAYVARRLALLLPTLCGVSIVSFLVVHWMPGDPAEILAGEHASTQVVEQIRHDLGLDRPLPQQYGRWVRGLLHGDLGRSAKTHEEITVEIARAFPATVELATAALLLASLGGVALGLAAARRPGGLFDAGSMSVASIGVSMPVFWLGLLLMYTFAVRFPVLPVSGRGLATDDTPLRTGFLVVDALLAGRTDAALTTLRHLILPAIVLGTVPTAIIARVTRSSLVDVLGRDYIRTARAKGLDEWRVLLRHAVRNGVLPTLTVIGLQFGALLGGAIITETIFSWPGIGRWILLGVEGRDAAVLQAGVLLMALTFSLVNLFTDLLYAALDPRIKLE
jgi:ABC-type dipeptide/oligopeptide/nickel transport system permease component